jgi:hypothetical protein
MEKKECPICINELNINNIIKLDCGSNVNHYCCKICYNKLLEKSNNICPICRGIFRNISIYYKIKNIILIFVGFILNYSVIFCIIYILYNAFFDSWVYLK